MMKMEDKGGFPISVIFLHFLGDKQRTKKKRRIKGMAEV
jgi:hypothetical protein